jgi:hypothetical protein
MKTNRFIALLGVGLALCLNAQAAYILGTDRLLGTVEPGTPADPNNEAFMINFLVNAYNTGLYANGIVHDLGDNPLDGNTEVNFLNVDGSTLLPAFGLLNTTVTTDPLNHAVGGGTGVYTITTGAMTYEYLTAKYGNRTAVFYVGGIVGEITVPTLSDPGGYFQGAGNGNGYGLSGTDFYNGSTPSIVTPPRNVPDGGTTLSLMGLALTGLAAGRRFLAK